MRASWWLAGLVGVVVAARAGAQELVQNGGFETGDVDGWTLIGTTTDDGVWNGMPHTGMFSAFFGAPTATPGGIQQSLPVSFGRRVAVSFWFTSENGLTPSSIVVWLGSLQLLSLNNVASSGSYQHFVATVTTAESNPILKFAFTDPNDYIDLDDVSVQPVSCGTADFNCDGDVGSDADIYAFFACLSGSCPPAPCSNSADFNRDGDVGTDLDIDAFFHVLSGGSC
jgi:hypothetical protein